MATSETDLQRLVREYEAAMAALEAASAALVAHIANNTSPQTAEIYARDFAGARLIAAASALRLAEPPPLGNSNLI